jgi:S1/P1 Nuclease
MQGETCKVNKSSLCSPLAVTDLHTLWDSTLIQRQYFSWGKYVDDLENEKGWLNSKEAQHVVSEDPTKWSLQWAVETHCKAQDVWRMTPQAQPRLAAETVSTCPKDTVVDDQCKNMVLDDHYKNTVLDDQYLKCAMNIINRQLGVAGLRLAAFLNNAYASCPVPHS